MFKLYYSLNNLSEEKIVKDTKNYFTKPENYDNLTQKQQNDYYLSQVAESEEFSVVIALTKKEALDENIRLKLVNKFMSLKKAGFKGNNIVVSVLDDSHHFTEEEWAKIKKLNNQVSKLNNVQFGFEDQGKTWDIEKVENN